MSTCIASIARACIVVSSAEIITKRHECHDGNQLEIPKREVEHMHKSCLVEIQHGVEYKKPLFLVHPVAGDVYFYQDLATALGSQVPIYMASEH
ncbi:unnamed protein product [Didymodactylos carnosus]|uniref:Uncharacterized protein n=1 Tax=Didymodactylos carnosus TaxID=1234261 RepID=A0A813T9J8_9BILA|nr:unnamed protein product [Didymodactylos carnosus]CAF3596420.1 unnamed protein product [Didymodactylos carnosus]